MRVPRVRPVLVCVLAALLLGTGVGAAWSYLRLGPSARNYQFSKPTASHRTDSASPTTPAKNRSRPLLVVEGGTEYDFGVMSRNEQRSHTFVIRNSGDDTLQIRFLDKSCMCTEVILTKTEVPPNETTEILMTWQPSTFNLGFQQSARFETNDPRSIELDLTVKGKVQQVVQATPRALSFDGVTAGREREQEFHVYAYQDPNLSIERLEFLDPDTADFFETEIADVNQETLAAETGAVAGQRIAIHLKPGLPLGRFHQRLRVHLNQPELGPLEVPIVGSIVGNVTFVGQGYDEGTGIWYLGKLSGDQPHTKTLWIFVKGEHAADVQVSVGQLEPSSVMQAEITNHGAVNAVARHALKVTLTPQGQVVNRLGNDQGPLAEITIMTTHPDATEMRIPLAFALESANSN